MKTLLKLFSFVFALFFITVGVMSISGCKDVNSEIDKRAMHYDADGYFVVIDDTNNVVAIYDANKPLGHFKQNIKCSEDYVVTTISKLPDYNIELAENVKTCLHSSYIPYDTPVVVFRM